jgi:protein-disulfide isomerase
MNRLTLAMIVLVLPSFAAAAPPDGQAEGRPKASATAPAPSQPGDDPSGITRQQADAILQELRSIRQLLERQAAPSARALPPPAAAPPPRVKVSIPPAAAATALGSKDAPVTVVEFIDFQCTYCQRHQDATFPRLKELYIDTGKVRYVSRDLPLDMHANALVAARAGRCAAAQDRYWDLRRAMFANTRQLSPPDLLGYARTVGLDVSAFETCMARTDADAAIRAESNDVAGLGITGTPSFVIGKTTAGAIEGALIVGAQPLASFEARLAELLGGLATAAAPAK